MQVKTTGISPKLLADLFVSAATFALANYGAGLDPELSALIGKLVGSIAAYIAGPGKVHVQGAPAMVQPVMGGTMTSGENQD